MNNNTNRRQFIAATAAAIIGLPLMAKAVAQSEVEIIIGFVLKPRFVLKLLNSVSKPLH